MSEELTQSDTHAFELSLTDQEALDALIAARLDPDAVEPALQHRARAVASILGVLEAESVDCDPSLIDVTMVRVRRSSTGITGDEPVLSGHDAEALDALVLAGFEVGRVPSALRDRAAAHLALGELVRADADAPSGTRLIESTLARVQDAIDRQDGLMSFERRRSMARVSWSDLISVAAVLLLGASVLWPVLSAARSSQIQAACAQSMHAAAFGLGSYASSNDGSLPMVTAGFGGRTWWNVGEKPDESNSANLFHLVGADYASLADLACAGNPLAPTNRTDSLTHDWRRLEEVSFSYRVMPRGERPRWIGSGRVVVMADRSPVVLRAVRGHLIDPEESSPNHRGMGQHVLWNDGSAQWTESPILENGDNLWLPRPIEAAIEQARRGERIRPIRGTETPAAMDDAFVGP